MVVASSASMVDFVRTPDSRFEGIPDYPFEPHYVEVEGLRMHYVDAGAERRESGAPSARRTELVVPLSIHDP